MNKLHLALASLVAVAACGGSVVAEGTGAGNTGTGASTTGSGAGNTGTGAATTGGGGSISSGPCPSSPPAAGSSCVPPDQFRCSYGDSVRPDCRSAFTCDNGSWAAETSSCIEPPPGECGASEPAPQTVCPVMGDVCVYGDAICFCGCGGGLDCAPPVDWQCSAPPTTPGCPPAVPNDGTPCAAQGVQCTYGDPCTPSGAVVSCSSGAWLWNTMIACGG